MNEAIWGGKVVRKIGETLQDQSESTGSFLAQIIEFLSQLWHKIF